MNYKNNKRIYDFYYVRSKTFLKNKTIKTETQFLKNAFLFFRKNGLFFNKINIDKINKENNTIFNLKNLDRKLALYCLREKIK